MTDTPQRPPRRKKPKIPKITINLDAAPHNADWLRILGARQPQQDAEQPEQLGQNKPPEQERPS